MSLNDPLYPRNSRPFGITFEDWTIKWWLWLLDIPKSINPTFDSDGKYAFQNQANSDVFFLCQTVEGSETMPCRTISISAGKAIFMPIINWLSISQNDGETDDELRAVAKEKIDEVANLDFTINGLPIRGTRDDFRVSSGPFETTLPEGNIFDIPPGSRRLISDGFWIFLKPPSNSVTLTSFGSCSSGLTRIGVNYDVKIVK